MPVTLADLTRETRTITLDLAAGTLTVTYAPAAVTPAMLSELLAQEASTETLVQFLVTVLRGWDVVDEGGETLPTDEKTLRALPVLFLNQVMEAISADLTPRPQTHAHSVAGSRPKGR